MWIIYPALFLYGAFYYTVNGPVSEQYVSLIKQLFPDSASTFRGIPTPPIVIAGMAIFYFYVLALATYSLRKSMQVWGKGATAGTVLTHGLLRLLDVFIVTPLVLLILALLAFPFLGEFIGVGDKFVAIGNELGRIYSENIPTLIEIPLPLAFVLTLVMAELPSYALHRLQHASRLFWYLTHRTHHTTEILHPMGVGPAVGFKVLSRIPLFLMQLLISKLLYTDGLLHELLMFYVLLAFCEPLNHEPHLYRAIMKNRFLRFIFSLTGCGPYHVMHHSAKEGEEAINLGGACFFIWDRLFGTYVKPRPDLPKVGLTNQPDMIMNPWIVNFSGFMTIIYELTHNSIRYWPWILCGSVYYKPPHSKEYLILGYSKPAVV
ncbi:MAG: hypothetical protein C4K60_19755 [Ideonella sp. MAG2]|nr:MAG: hypothetical protein C4K60_19755 [Ideonella sp. MAG2]